MDIAVFKSICKAPRDRQWLESSKFLTIEGQVAIFCITLCHDKSNRIGADRFQHSRETIHRHFRRGVLKAIVRLGMELIFPPNFDDVPAEIRNNTKYFPFFKVIVCNIF